MLIALISVIVIKESHGLPHPGYLFSPSEIDLLRFFYFVLPFLLAFAFGFLFRPFGKHFRDVLVGIFILHFFYSAGIYLLQDQRLYQWKKEVRLQAGEFKIQNITTRVSSEETARINIQIDTTKLQNGEYRLYFILSQDSTGLSQGQVGHYDFTKSKSTTSVTTEIQFRTTPYKEYFEKGTAYVDVGLAKESKVPASIKKVLFLGRWAAFFRPMAWTDPNWIAAQQMVDVEKIKIKWEQFEK